MINPDRTWFYSDPHFGHEELVNGDFTKRDGDKARPFRSVKEMDEHMIASINATVSAGDRVYCLGDFAMDPEHVERVVPRLRGEQVLILGNHDIWPATMYLQAGFRNVASYRIFNEIVFSHIPLAPWSVKSTLRGNVHGHCHLSKPLFYKAANPDEHGFTRAVRYLNLSMERINYRPVNLTQILEWLNA
jgi:calcineurin-like phosphoesterase family protein